MSIRNLEFMFKPRSVAVVGATTQPHSVGLTIMRSLLADGFAGPIMPVNPKYKEVLGEPCYSDLKSVPEHIDIVDIFRNVEAIPGIVDEAIAVGADCVWMQLGLVQKKRLKRPGVQVFRS